MHIAIEGLDGVGKTTIARLLAETLAAKFIEKPLQYLLLNKGGGLDQYLCLAEMMNAQPSLDLRVWYYGLQNVYFSEYYAKGDVVTDRYFLSNYAWNSNENNQKLFDILVHQIRHPDYTFLLTADEEALRNRIKGRNPHDKDLGKIDRARILQSRMEDGLTRYGFAHTILDCSNLTPENVLSEMLRVLKSNGLVLNP